MSEEKSDRGFTVVDKRAGREESEASATPEGDAAESPRTLPAIDFSTFVLSLGTSALYHLGLVADPETGEAAAPDVPLARQTIDTLEMLQVKTSGNLDAQEQQLLENLLYELRMRFVEAQK